MQRNENHFQSLGICHRIYNFIMSSLIGISLKRVTLGHPMPQGSYNERHQEEHARNEVQEPLISRAKLDGDGRGNSKPRDDPDSVVRVHFKQTEEELDYWNWTHVDKLGSSDYNDDEAMEKRNEFIDIDTSRNKEIQQLNGISLDTDKPQLHRKRGKNIIIPITDSASTKPAKRVGSDVTKPMLTGLGLNINEVSETFIQNTKERMSRNVSLTEEAAEFLAHKVGEQSL